MNFPSFLHKYYLVLKSWSNINLEIGLGRKQLNMDRKNVILLNYSFGFLFGNFTHNEFSFPQEVISFMLKNHSVWIGVNEVAAKIVLISRLSFNFWIVVAAFFTVFSNTGMSHHAISVIWIHHQLFPIDCSSLNLGINSKLQGLNFPSAVNYYHI